MKNIYLHVGYPKTATTTLQKNFFPNVESIQYVGKFDNEGLLFNFDSKIISNLIFKNANEIDFDSQRKLFAEILDKNKKPIVLSEESFVSNSLRVSRINKKDILPQQETIAKNIRNFFDKGHFDVKILFTIRKQDEMITSQYAQSYVHYYSKYKETDSFDKFLDIYLNKENQRHTFYQTLDYYHVISIYQELFGKENVAILVYEELQQEPELFYTKLCNFLEIDSDKYSEIAIQKCENKRSTDENYKRTRDVSLFDKLSQIKYKYFPFIKLKLSENIKDKLKNIVWTNNEQVSKTIFLTNEQKNEILERYEISNKRLSEMFDLNLKQYGYYND